MDLIALYPNPAYLAAAVALDLAIGDPVYAYHPVRLMGKTLTWLEDRLRRAGLDGYGGGICLFVLLGSFWVGITGWLAILAWNWRPAAGMVAHVFVLYSLVALHDLLRHAWAVEKAGRRGDLNGARLAIAKLVGRDTSRMDIPACRRAAIESMSENLTDGFLSPLFWYGIAGLPGVVVFKVVSTMDSMVGYKNGRYLRFGWCGARLDDLMNLLPARAAWLLLAAVALFIPGYSARKALTVGFKQHAVVPGPNAGWSEAAAAGALRRRLIGPIWAGGELVTQVWLGDPSDPPAGESSNDVPRAGLLTTASGLAGSALTLAWLSI